jgi:hypothetical protein
MTINPLENPYGTAFGWMDEIYGLGTAKALQECGGPWECWIGSSWEPKSLTYFNPSLAYRKKPAPKKPIWLKELWMNVDADKCHQMHYTKEEADFYASEDRIACIRYTPAPETEK